jgi:hypothetical protein
MAHVNLTITLPTSTRTVVTKSWTTSILTKTVTATSVEYFRIRHLIEANEFQNHDRQDCDSKWSDLYV